MSTIKIVDMTLDKLNPEIIFAQLDEVISSFVELLSSADEKAFDKVPFENSWTVAQLASHVTKSNKAIAQALAMQGKPAERCADERVEELRKMFLDFNIKFQSPEFILPTINIYPKKEVIEKYKSSIEQLTTVRGKINLSEVISLPAFGEITKFELLNFVVFHTIRHTRQLKNILHTLQSE